MADEGSKIALRILKSQIPPYIRYISDTKEESNLTFPNIPSVTPTISITRDDALNLLLSSIAFEELGLSHIINAEGEKIQYVLGTIPGLSGLPATIAEVLAVDQSVKNTLDTTIRKELLLQAKLESVLSAPTLLGPTGATGPTGPAGRTCRTDRSNGHDR